MHEPKMKNRTTGGFWIAAAGPRGGALAEREDTAPRGKEKAGQEAAPRRECMWTKNQLEVPHSQRP